MHVEGKGAHVCEYAPATPEPYGDVRTAANRDNDYFMDWEVHRTRMYCGIPGFGVQDQAIQESQGPIVDRAQERLGTSDTAIIQVRRRLHRRRRGRCASTARPRPAPIRASFLVRSASVVLPPGASWVEGAMAAHRREAGPTSSPRLTPDAGPHGRPRRPRHRRRRRHRRGHRRACSPRRARRSRWSTPTRRRSKPRRPRIAERGPGAQVLALAARPHPRGRRRRVVDEAVGALGALHTLVNVAGVRVYAPLADADRADWERIIGVNVLGHRLLLQGRAAARCARRGAAPS